MPDKWPEDMSAYFASERNLKEAGKNLALGIVETAVAFSPFGVIVDIKDFVEGVINYDKENAGFWYYAEMGLNLVSIITPASYGVADNASKTVNRADDINDTLRGTENLKDAIEGTNVDELKKIIKNGEVKGNNIICKVDDNTQVIFRQDTGVKAHPIRSHGYDQPVNHYNVEIQTKTTAGKWKSKWSYHIILDDKGNIIGYFD